MGARIYGKKSIAPGILVLPVAIICASIPAHRSVYYSLLIDTENARKKLYEDDLLKSKPSTNLALWLKTTARQIKNKPYSSRIHS